jgi:hypothetical protein
MVATTFQPCLWKNFAVALSMPLELPVTRMVLDPARDLTAHAVHAVRTR